MFLASWKLESAYGIPCGNENATCVLMLTDLLVNLNTEESSFFKTFVLSSLVLIRYSLSISYIDKKCHSVAFYLWSLGEHNNFFVLAINLHLFSFFWFFWMFSPFSALLCGEGHFNSFYEHQLTRPLLILGFRWGELEMRDCENYENNFVLCPCR